MAPARSKAKVNARIGANAILFLGKTTNLNLSAGLNDSKGGVGYL